MDDQLTTILDALQDVKLLPRRPQEADVFYGYVARDAQAAVAAQIVTALRERGYEVHRCDWAGESVLLAINNGPQPLAIRLTTSATERYNLYALSRPTSAQTLWQWAQATVRHQARTRRGTES